MNAPADAEPTPRRRRFPRRAFLLVGVPLLLIVLAMIVARVQGEQFTNCLLPLPPPKTRFTTRSLPSQGSRPASSSRALIAVRFSDSSKIASTEQFASP